MPTDIAKLLLRLILGLIILLHGLYKLLHGIGPVRSIVLEHDLPGMLAYLVLIGEVVGPLLILLGLYTRVGALLIAIDIGVAIALAHAHQWLHLASNGAWAIETEAMFFVTALVIALLGAGRFSLGTASGRWN